MRGGGSSTALSSALDACSVSRSASSITTTCQRPSTGRRAERATIARISATGIDRPSGTTEWTSGWLRVRTVWHAGHSPAAARGALALQRGGERPGGHRPARARPDR